VLLLSNIFRFWRMRCRYRTALLTSWLGYWNPFDFIVKQFWG